GTLRCGLRVSSAAVETASNPTYAKKIDAAAPTMPRPEPSPLPNQPFGANGSKCAPLSTGRVSAMNTVSARILISTSTALTRALSVVPIIRRRVTASAITTAGRLNMPWVKSTEGIPSTKDQAGPAASAVGSSKPVALLTRPMKYPDQPTDTADAATAYSRISAQPTTQASSSPITA